MPRTGVVVYVATISSRSPAFAGCARSTTSLLPSVWYTAVAPFTVTLEYWSPTESNGIDCKPSALGWMMLVVCPLTTPFAKSNETLMISFSNV